MGKQSKKSEPKSKKSEDLKKQFVISSSTNKICDVCTNLIQPNCKNEVSCSSCKKYFHKFCYSPTHEGRSLICDFCTSKKKEAKCFVCQEGQQIGLLKIIGQRVFHVDCIIFSPHQQFESFSTFNTVQKKHSSKISTTVCKICKKKDNNTYLKCQLCDYSAHYKCLWLLKLTGTEFSFVSNWLDKCEKENYLLGYLLKHKKTSLNHLLRSNPKQLPHECLIICQNHPNPKNFCWCPCDNPELNPSDFNNWLMCDKCDRYSHRICTGLNESSDEQYVCKGCTAPEKDIFLSEIKIHQIIQQITKIEIKKDLTNTDIRFLNSFPFTYSLAIEIKIQDNLKLIEEYFVRKQIQDNLGKIDEEIQIQLSEEQKISVRLLVLFILNGENKQINMKKLSDPEETKKILEDIETTKKNIVTDKKSFDKIRQIFKNLIKTLTGHHKLTFIKERLIKFISICNSNEVNRSTSGIDQISELLYQISNTLQQIKNESNTKNSTDFILAFQQKFQGTFMWTLLDRKRSKEQMKIIVQKHGATQYLIHKNKDLEEQVYWNLKRKYFQKIHEKQMLGQKEEKENFRTQNFFKDSLKKIKVKSTAVNKHQQKLDLQQSIAKKENMDLQQYQKLQERAIIRNVAIFGENTQFQSYQTTKTQMNIVKKTYLTFCSKKQQDITESDFKQILKLDEFLNQKDINLAELEKQKIQIFKRKLIIFSQIFDKAVIVQKTIQVKEKSDPSPKVFLKFISMLSRWKNTELPISFMIAQLHNIMQVNIHFSNSLIEQAIANFANNIGNYLKNLKKQGKKLQGKTLKDAISILKYYNKLQNFETLSRDFDTYQQWITINPSIEPLDNILQDPVKNQNLLKIIYNILLKAENLVVDISQDVKKLKVLKLWCIISSKINGFKTKPTINAIQNIKIYLDKLSYPRNSLWNSVNILATEGIEQNKQISKLLQKPKLGQFMEIYEELQIMNLKMTYSEVTQIKQKLSKSNLDIQAEIQQIGQELKQYEEITNNFQQTLNIQNLKQLKKFRYRCFDSSIKVNDLSKYHKLIMRICELRCYNFGPSITKQEYYQLVNFGGVASLQLRNKTIGLNNVYKSIEKARQQLVNGNKERRNFSILIPWVESKIHQIKQQLKIDLLELSYFQKAQQHSLKLRNAYFRSRLPHPQNHRIQLSSIIKIENQMLMTIFNHKQLINQIKTIKADHYDIVKRVEQYLHSSSTQKLQNLDVFEKNILSKYRKINIRSQALEIFQHDAKTYKQLRELSQSLIDNSTKNIYHYHRFNFLYKKISENYLKVPEIILLRERVFFIILKKSMEMGSSQIDIWNTLIDEGLELKRLGAPQKDQVFTKIFQLYAKIKQEQDCSYPKNLSDEQDRLINSRKRDNCQQQFRLKADNEDGNENKKDCEEIENILNDFSQNDQNDDESRENDQIGKNIQGRKLNHNQIILDD